ncbi:MAG: UDP-N-acetylmuramoylalanyl-D-glutamyl-2,6-diaminopimelate--D-alanyl-D-alanine ligase [Alphaproteobacteria bacterium]|nr:UDP-N-acetylmuramoylalanyl-D-glutamyl-2,6-diaminopimelate--D-alanyl-D-alanine ligase [Alphaproteobacteria bacterium]
MINPLWLAEDVVRAVRGRCLHEQSWTAQGVSIDSRTTAAGDLFIALQGPAHDGHDHVAAAFAAGAAAALVARQPSQTPPDAPLVFVEDTFAALHELGRAGRDRAQGKIIAVTGSVGKTSTKEMLRLALSAVGKTHANAGSFNNHWGLPLTLARMPADADYGILEMGMNHVGELAALSKLARPDIALVTTIEAAHLEFFANVEAIADAKAEIFEGLGDGGIAVLNRSNPHFARLAAAAKNRGVKTIMSFAREGKADAVLIDCALTGESSAVNAAIAGKNISYTIGAPGMHTVQNSLGALLTAFAASGKVQECAAALAHYKPPKGRGVAQSVGLQDGSNFTLIDDSYNAASPAAVRASIGVLAAISPTHQGRRIMVLGDMRELGITSPALHADLAPDIVEAKIDIVFCCGEMMRYLYDALPAERRGAFAPDSEALAPFVAAAARADDVVAVKGSKSMEMGQVIEALKIHSEGAVIPENFASMR